MSLELVIYKKCYIENGVEVNFDQVTFTMPDSWPKGCNEESNAIREQYLLGKSEGHSDKDENGIFSKWSVKPLETSANMRARKDKLKVAGK